MGQTVNLLAYAFGGSNPSLPTETECTCVHSVSVLPQGGGDIRKAPMEQGSKIRPVGVEILEAKQSLDLAKR